MKLISKLTGGALAATGAVLAIGTILSGPGGETLDAFTRDTDNRDRCASVGGCPAVWRMITTHGSPSATHGVNRSLLGTIAIRGAHQVTYAGRPLYGCAQADGAGNTSAVGAARFGGSRPAISPTGHLAH